MFFPNKTKVVSTNVFLGEDQLIEDSSVNNYIIVVWFYNLALVGMSRPSLV